MRQFFIALALLGAAASAVHAAEYQYVSDKLIITLRNGQGNSHQSIGSINPPFTENLP